MESIVVEYNDNTYKKFPSSNKHKLEKNSSEEDTPMHKKQLQVPNKVNWNKRASLFAIKNISNKFKSPVNF